MRQANYCKVIALFTFSFLLSILHVYSESFRVDLCVRYVDDMWISSNARAIVLGRLCNVVGRAYSTAKMPSTGFTPKEYKGPTYEQLEHLKSKHMPPAIPNSYKKPVLLHQGHMQWLFDHEGKRYLDLFGGVVTVSVGNSHPKLNAALKEQIDLIWHTTNLYRHPRIYEYIEKLSSKLPDDLNVVYLVNSGTEANDLATILAKAYTGNLDVISLQTSYHGYNSSLMGLSATQSYRMNLPVPPGFYHAAHPDPYRGSWGGCRDSISQVAGACSCPDECVSTEKYIHQLDELLGNSVPAGRVAAFFAESIQGAGGVVQFPKGYLKRAQELIKKNGGLYVADEVQTGFGRTGDHYWGFETHGVKPDIVTMAKGIGNGFPLAAVVTTKEIAAAHSGKSYFNTFGGNALAATVGKAVLDVIDEEELQKNSKTVGEYFIRQLMELQKQHPVIGDVRGQGLMIGVELVEPGTKKPLPVSLVKDIHEEIKDNGVLVVLGGRWSNVFRMKPPMCITKADVDFGISVIDDAIKKVTKK